ncbi:AlpA family phage regulatory protein [Escherichia coli]
MLSTDRFIREKECQQLTGLSRSCRYRLEKTGQFPSRRKLGGRSVGWSLSVLAFGRQAEALAKHRKGELLSVAGNMQVSQWTGQNGETRRGWQVIADSVISARTARPGGKKGQQGQATDALNRAKQQSGNDDPYGDNIPF